MTSPPHALGAACPSCGAPFYGRYCHRCGEKKLAPEDRTVRHFVADILGTLFNLDSTFWRTFRLLLVKPGALTAAHLRGERRPYLSPFKVFVLCNLVYFFVQPYTGFTGFVTDLYSHTHRQPYSEQLALEHLVRARLQADTLPPDAYRARYARYAERFDARSSAYARSLILLLIPLVALGLLLVIPRRLLADHVVFATHLLAWLFLVGMSIFLFVYSAFLDPLVDTYLPPTLADIISEGGTLVLFVPYLYLALRRAYGLTRAGAAWRTLAFAAPPVVFVPGLLLTALYGYRLLLFWLTFWTTPVPV